MSEERDERKKQHEEMLWATVRIAADNAWGSGTVVFSGQTDKKGEYLTYVITCFHVVASNIKIEKKFDQRVGYDIKKETRVPVEVQFFYYEKLSKCAGIASSVKANIVAYDEDADIALLELRKSAKVTPVATMFPEKATEEIHVYDPVWACGAAMAHEPIATQGIINFMNEMMETGIEYWMSSAQIIFGNSGGAMFRYSNKRDKYEFIGIPARVTINMAGYSQDAITHMGFFVPVPMVYKFLRENFYTFIFDPNTTMEECKANRENFVKEREKLLMAKYGGEPEKPKLRE